MVVFLFLKELWEKNWYGIWFYQVGCAVFLMQKIQPMEKQKTESVTLTNNGNDNIQLDYAELRKAVIVLRAVNHKLRQQIIDLLDENDSMAVTDIYVSLRLEQSVASQHLAILRRAGVVETERQGKYIFYALNRERLSQIGKLVEELAAG